MANHLKMEIRETILSLHRRGWSKRRIARELGVDRSAVRRALEVSGGTQKHLGTEIFCEHLGTEIFCGDFAGQTC